jgi:hypothetical protein
MKPKHEEDIATPIEKLDRTIISNFKQYMLDNPTYMEDTLGYIMTEDELDKYIIDNISMFSDNYILKKNREKRRNL